MVGIKIPGSFAPGTVDGFVTEARWIKGTYIVVNTLDDANAIPEGVRVDGTLIYDLETGFEYRWESDTWVIQAKSFADAPKDGKIYARQNGVWTIIDVDSIENSMETISDNLSKLEQQVNEGFQDVLEEVDKKLENYVPRSELSRYAQIELYAYPDAPAEPGNENTLYFIKTVSNEYELKIWWPSTSSFVTIGSTDVNLDDYYTKAQVDTKLSELEASIPDTSSFATKEELSNLATEDELAVVESKIPDVSSFITKSVDDLVNYYLKSETYTKSEVDRLIESITSISFEVVSELPTTGESNKIYLKLKEDSTNNSYEEYIWVNEKWELIGSTEVDLSNYVTTDDFTSTLETYVKSEDLSNTLSEYITSEQLTTALSSKQDTLVSGTNVKTINSQSILGEGDIQIEGVPGKDGVDGQNGDPALMYSAVYENDAAPMTKVYGLLRDKFNRTPKTGDEFIFVYKDTGSNKTYLACATVAAITNQVNSDVTDFVETTGAQGAKGDNGTGVPDGGTAGQFLQKTDDGTAWASIDLSSKADTNGTYPDMTVGNATNATTAQSATTATSATTAETATNATNATHAINADKATSDVEGNAILSTYAKITALNETNATLQEVQEKANEADAIARGKATSYVFETLTALDDWLEVPENVAKLHVGDNFYIEDVGVPDYWWNGEARMVLESEKPDMSNYYSKDEVDTRLGQKANTDGTYSSMSVGFATTAQSAENANHATTADSATNATHATSADTATSATTAQSATMAESATNATNAVNATTATNAGHASTADSATKATQDANGSVIDTTYAKRSQVVTKDNSTNSISALSQDAKYLLRNKQILTSAVTISETGWYRIAQLTECSSSRITVMKGYGPGRGVSLILDIAVGADDTDKTTNIVASYAGMKGQSDYIDKIRYSPAGGSNVYIDVHIVSSGSQSIYWMAYDGASTNTAFISGGFALYDFQKTSATGGTELLMPEDTGLTTTGTIYQNSTPVLIGDQSAIFESDETTVKKATKATQDGDGNVISTTYVKVNEIPSAEITKQAVADALGCTTAQLDILVALAQKINVDSSNITSTVRITAPEFNDN